MTAHLLEVHGLSVAFTGEGRGRAAVSAVDGVSFHLDRAETLGLVGESGSGKSTIGNAILGLVRASGGRIVFDGDDITHAPPGRRRQLGRRIQVIFQDPRGSLNPSLSVGQTIAEPLRVVRRLGRREAADRTVQVLRRVGMPSDAVFRYPGEFSGGQRQRIAIARALALEPELIVCDEPTSALDLSVQAQILNLLLDLQERFALSYLFISHDIDVIRHMSHRAVVLRRGRVVEEGPVDQITEHPEQEYTRALIDAVPLPDPRVQRQRREARRRRAAAADGVSA